MYKITRILLYCCTVIKGTFTSFLKHGLLPTVRNWRYNRVWRSDRVCVEERENSATKGGLFSSKITGYPQHWQSTYPGTLSHLNCH